MSISIETLCDITITRYLNLTEYKIKGIVFELNHNRYTNMSDEESTEDFERFKKYHLKYNEVKMFEIYELKIHDTIRKEYKTKYKHQPYPEYLKNVYIEIYKEYTKILRERTKLFNNWFIFNYYGLELPPKKVQAKIIKPKVKIIGKKEMNIPLKDVCGICLENHEKLDSILTCCNHEFGKICFESWSSCCKKSGKIVKCPLCKKENPCTTSFKLRKSPIKKVKKMKLIIEEDDPNNSNSFKKVKLIIEEDD